MVSKKYRNLIFIFDFLILFLLFSKPSFAICIGDPTECYQDSDCWIGGYSDCYQHCCVGELGDPADPPPGGDDPPPVDICNCGTQNCRTYDCTCGYYGCKDSKGDSCYTHLCCDPVDGGLSGWTACDKECDGGVKVKYCNNPYPSCGGSTRTCKDDCADSGGTWANNVCVISCNTQPCCTVDQGDLSDWGSCVNGKQTRTCTGTTCCGTDCGNCNNAALERPCLYVEGNIWSDWNGNGSRELSETFKDSSLSGCSTTSTYDSFYLWYSGETGDQLRRWWCHSTLGAYYNSGMGTDANIEPEEPHKFSIASSQLPANHTCGTWEYWTSAGKQGSGDGCVTDTFTMPATGWQNVHWKLNCTVNQGNLSDWGSCVNGKQTRTCTGTTCCGPNCGNCSNAALERPCLRIEGNIWSDDNMDGNQDTGESWKGNDALSCTNKLWDQFSMTATLESGNQVSNWFCHSNSRSYYNSPNGEIEPEYSKVFTLDSDRVPPYSKCGFWEYYNQENGSNLVASGDGCTTSNLTMPTSGWINVNFELCKGVWVDSEQCDTLCGPGKLIRTCQWSDSSCTGEPTCDPAILPTDCNPGVCHYTLVPTVRRILPEMELPGECPVNPTDWDDYNLLIGGNVKAQSSDGTYSVTLQTGDDGKVSFDVPYNYTQVVFSSDTDTGGVEPENYSLKCPTQNYVYPESAFDYLPSHTVPWNNGLGTYPSYNLNLGVQAIPKNGWFSAVDSDIFANDYLVVVPDGPTDNESEAQTPKGFAKSLINSSSNNDYSLGFLSSQADLIANPALGGCSDNKVFENNPDCDIDYGGYSVNLLSNGISHTSKWLESFTFSPPSEALDIGGDPMKLIKTSSPLVLNSGVFSAEHSVIEGILGPVGDITYSVDGSGLTIIYVNGDLNIDNKLTASSSTSGRLLLIVNGSVTVDSNVGTAEASFLMSQNPDIGAGIIASGSVVFPSINNERKTEENRDKPIMVSAPLISKNSISFSRDLYHDYNARIPAQSAKAFNKYLYLLTSLERQESQDNLYFTGVTTFDLDWEYIY